MVYRKAFSVGTFFWLAAGMFSPFVPATASAAQEAAAISLVEAAPAEGENPMVTAVGIRHAPAADAAQGPKDILLLIDTSASQIGAYQRQAIDAARGFVEKVGRGDRVRVAAVDVSCVPMTTAGDGFARSDSSTVNEAIAAVSARTPLGSTDIVEVLLEAADLFPASSAPRVLLYIGDGPGLNGIDVESFSEVLDRLRTKNISCSSIGIGPQINWPCLAAIANATGGMLLVPDEAISAADAGSRMAEVAAQPVWWPVDVAVTSDSPGELLRMLPGALPPLRTDRDSIVLFEGPVAGGRISMALGSQIVPPIGQRLPQPIGSKFPVERRYFSAASWPRRARSGQGRGSERGGHAGCSFPPGGGGWCP